MPDQSPITSVRSARRFRAPKELGIFSVLIRGGSSRTGGCFHHRLGSGTRHDQRAQGPRLHRSHDKARRLHLHAPTQEMGRKVKKVFVVCATGIATSTMVRMRVEEYLNERGIKAEISQYRVGELSADRIDADVIVSTSGMPPEFAKVVPVVNGVPFLTGIGEEAALKEIEAALSALSLIHI